MGYSVPNPKDKAVRAEGHHNHSHIATIIVLANVQQGRSQDFLERGANLHKEWRNLVYRKPRPLIDCNCGL